MNLKFLFVIILQSYKLILVEELFPWKNEVLPHEFVLKKKIAREEMQSALFHLERQNASYQS